MWDESGEYEEVVCLVCGESLEVDCGHRLATIDVTFGQCVGGAAFDHWDGYEKQVSTALSPYATSDIQPRWEQYAVQSLWDSAREEADRSGEFALLAGPFNDLIVSVLGAAGGTEHPGSLCDSSGPYCESSMRILFADNPQQVCEQAAKVLEKWLVPLPSDADTD